MKKKIFYVLMIACIGMTAIINTSCSNETDLVANGQQEKAGPKGVLISFGLSAEDYGTDNEAATRGVSDAQTGRVIATSTSNLGNGLEVLTEVVEDNAPKTRAGNDGVPSQNYTILAYKDGQKMAEWKGSVPIEIPKQSNKELDRGTSFILASNSPSSDKTYLQPGVYKFYVFNDKRVEIKPDESLNITIAKGSRDAFYFEGDVTIQNVKEQKLDFVLRPMFARVRTKLKTYVQGALTGKFNGFSVFKAGTPYNKTINPKTGEAAYTPETADGRFGYGEFENDEKEGNDADGTKHYYVISPKYTGNFFLEGTMLSQVSFEIPTGTGAWIFGKPAGGTDGIKMPTNLKKDVKLEAGKSYTLVYTMYNLGSYLFSDGSVSSLAVGKSANKTPIAFVVDTEKKIAIALNNVQGTKQWSTTNSQKATKPWDQSEQALREGIAEYNGVNAQRGGFKETWLGTNTNDGRVRADNADFPAFNAVKNFTPALAGKSWYVPGVGDWALALKAFGVDDPAAGFQPTGAQKNIWNKATTQNLGYKYQDIVFTQAGGTPLNAWYWTANSWNAGGETAITVTTGADGVFFGGAKMNNATLVRPFINY